MPNSRAKARGGIAGWHFRLQRNCGSMVCVAVVHISGGIYRFSLWNGNTKLLSEDNGTMDSSVTLAPGTCKLTFAARNTAGAHDYATRGITVQ